MKINKLYKSIFSSLVFSCLALAPLYVKGQKKIGPEAFVTVDIIVKDTLMRKNAFVEFEMIKDGLNTSLNIDKAFYKFQINGTQTKHKVPLSTVINYGRFSYNYENQFVPGTSVQMPLNFSNNLFIFQNGDNIQIDISKNEVSFSGKGSEKYNCSYQISKEREFKTTADVNTFYHQKQYDAMFEAIKRQLDSSYALRLDILKRYQSKLNPDIYHLIAADCWGTYGYQLVGILSSRAYVGDQRGVYDEAINTAYHRWFGRYDYRKFSDNLLVRSYQYGDFLNEKGKFELYFLISPEPGTYNKHYTFRQMYKSVQRVYSGSLRDKMNLLLFYDDLESKPDANMFFNPALTSMDNNIFRKALLGLQKHFTGNAYPFELPDATGSMHKLSDYTGKLIVMDFWFTGCMGCASLAKEMIPIAEAYKSNPEVVFITVSIDKSKDVWLKSLREGKYCSNDEVNLFTEGMQDRHPLIKHYNLLSFPTLMVISKTGKVITMAPPRPETGKPETTEAFKNLINRNL